MSDFDEVLSSVLREVVDAEPQTGLEARVLARVHADGVRPGTLLTWRRAAWALVPLAACAGLVLTVRTSQRGSSVLEHELVAGTHSPVPARLAASETAKDLSGLRRVPSPGVRMVRGAARIRSSDAGRRRSRDQVVNPKLATFPAIAQRGDLTGWIGRSTDGRLVKSAREASPQTAEAYRELRAAQADKLEVAALSPTASIEIEPLSQRSSTAEGANR